MLCSLRLSGGGSFPKPLSAEEEAHYLELSAQGDLAARNVLIERNLRLVAHIMRKTTSDVSLSDYIETGKEGDALSLMDTICSDEDLFENLSTRELYGRLYEIIGRTLSEREKTVVTLRYGLGGHRPQTQREVAAQLGISRSYVSRIEKHALELLQAALAGYEGAG